MANNTTSEKISLSDIYDFMSSEARLHNPRERRTGQYDYSELFKPHGLAYFEKKTPRELVESMDDKARESIANKFQNMRFNARLTLQIGTVMIEKGIPSKAQGAFAYAIHCLADAGRVPLAIKLGKKILRSGDESMRNELFDNLSPLYTQQQMPMALAFAEFGNPTKPEVQVMHRRLHEWGFLDEPVNVEVAKVWKRHAAKLGVPTYPPPV